MSKKKRRKPRSPGKPLWYKLDPRDKRQIILKNGTRLRQPIVGLGLYISQGMSVYGISPKGLRKLHVNFWKKNTYGKCTETGTTQGQNYPYVVFRGHIYRIHQLMAMAWLGGIPDGFVTDHINGDIDDSRLVNIRVIRIPENNRCGGILKRLRNVAIKRDDPGLNPLLIAQADLIEIFERTRGVKGEKLTERILQEVERYRVLVSLRHAAMQLRDPSVNPDNMPPARRNKVLSTYRVDTEVKVIDLLPNGKQLTKKINFNKKTLWKRI